MNRAVQLQKMAGGLKFKIEAKERLYYLYSENKGADQLLGTKLLICGFLFAYAKNRFSHDAAHFSHKYTQNLSNAIIIYKPT